MTETATPTAFSEMVRCAGYEGISQAYVAQHVTPAAVAANAGRIYDWMKEIGFGEDSWTRECMFAFAAEAFGVSYEVFYEAWMAQTPAKIEA